MPANGKWNREVAEYVLSWKFSPADRRRVKALNAKANENQLTWEEDEELKEYILLGNLITIAQMRALRATQRRSSAA